MNSNYKYIIGFFAGIILSSIFFVKCKNDIGLCKECKHEVGVDTVIIYKDSTPVSVEIPKDSYIIKRSKPAPKDSIPYPDTTYTDTGDCDENTKRMLTECKTHANKLAVELYTTNFYEGYFKRDSVAKVKVKAHVFNNQLFWDSVTISDLGFDLAINTTVDAKKKVHYYVGGSLQTELFPNWKQLTLSANVAVQDKKNRVYLAQYNPFYKQIQAGILFRIR